MFEFLTGRQGIELIFLLSNRHYQAIFEYCLHYFGRVFSFPRQLFDRITDAPLLVLGGSLSIFSA